VLDDNHELGMVQSDSRIQQLLAKRSSAERVPDPTIGLRYSNEKEGEEKVAGIYVWCRSPSACVVPMRSGTSSCRYAQQREAFTRRRLEGDVYAAYTQAVNSYQSGCRHRKRLAAVRENAELLARAYSLGESSLSDVLNARRMALESSLAATTAQLDANEARYRLLLDAHQLWPLDVHGGDNQK